ncbi:hypothetical protein JCM5353_000561 [Sporobolomyces roseus]
MSALAVKEVKGEVQDPSEIDLLLLDTEGAISDQPKGENDEKVCGRSGLNAFAKDTNGEEMTDETYNEIVEYLDVTEEGELTFKGFIQLSQLQTENDASETENDLKAWGYVPATLELDKSAKEGIKRDVISSGAAEEKR